MARSEREDGGWLPAGFLVRACNIIGARLTRLYPDGKTQIGREEFVAIVNEAFDTVIEQTMTAHRAQIMTAFRARSGEDVSNSNVGGLDMDGGGGLSSPGLRREDRVRHAQYPSGRLRRMPGGVADGDPVDAGQPAAPSAERVPAGDYAPDTGATEGRASDEERLGGYHGRGSV